MFDVQIISHGSAKARKQAVEAIVTQRVQAKTFSYTELMSQQEPLVSDGMEVLDGVIVENTIPKYGHRGPVTWEEGIVLVSVDPKGRIKHGVTERRRVPGTDQVQYHKRWKDFGNAAVVSDVPGERIARMILRQSGWPHLQVSTKGARIGTVVEWRWLEREVARPDAAEEVLDLYANIITREEFLKLGVYKPQGQQANKSQKPGASQVGASP